MRLVAPEFADVCDVLNGGVSALVALMADGAEERVEVESDVLAASGVATLLLDELRMSACGVGLFVSELASLVSLRQQV
jgi:hypothetical protein